MDASSHTKLMRDVRREALLRMEDAARTECDFNDIVEMWNKLDANRQRRERDHEIGRPLETMQINTSPDAAVIPSPAGYTLWQQMMRGDFVDVVFDCAYDLHELVEDRDVSFVLRDLSENHREILYFSAIRLYSNAKIAAMRNQSDRNIRKSRSLLIKKIRAQLLPRLRRRQARGNPLTLMQASFLESYSKK